MHVMSTNFAIFGLGFVGFFFVGFPLAFGGFSYAPFMGLEAPVGDALDRQRQLGVPVAGRLGADRHRYRGAGGTGRGVLLLHGRVHGHGGDDPHRRHGRTVEVEQRSSAGACSAVRSTTRCSRRGRGAAAGWPSSATRAELGFGYVDFAGSGVVHAVGGVGGARRARSCSVLASASTARTASRARCRATTSRSPCSACSSCCSAGSASTPHRPSPRPTCASPSRRRTRPSRLRSVRPSRCSAR